MAAAALTRCGGGADACLGRGYAMFQAPSLDEVTPHSGEGGRWYHSVEGRSRVDQDLILYVHVHTFLSES